MPHFLLTNDDGIDAPGLAALEKAVASLPDARLTIVAPATEQSQCGHRVTTATALRVDTRSESRFAVHGTPADCVRLALVHLEALAMDQAVRAPESCQPGDALTVQVQQVDSLSDLLRLEAR